MTTPNGNGNGNRHGATDEKVNISTDPISPKSKKVYVSGTLHPDIKVPFREISLSPSTTVTENGNGYQNDESSLIVYDTSGPYTDPD
ncbi:MAG TPA: phosphomethylpyrimidine synthase ThiC, partial [Nitrospina sp.]|nr:phosphomethylpyrimidine synthase ThiC [Nitrospina sp.]